MNVDAGTGRSHKSRPRRGRWRAGGGGGGGVGLDLSDGDYDACGRMRSRCGRRSLENRVIKVKRACGFHGRKEVNVEWPTPESRRNPVARYKEREMTQ